MLTRRREVLRETLAAFEVDPGRAHFARCAAENLDRWRTRASPSPPALDLRVLPDDWGNVAARLTREFGTVFAVLNMANAHVPGGAYVEGAAAQEENMFRRTDCHFSITTEHLDLPGETYTPKMTALLNGEEGRVYLDVDHLRLCIRGPEDRTAGDLGYRFLADDEIFPFYELRAAAQDLRVGGEFDAAEAGRRIDAQLDTLIVAGLRHAVLGAMGCGAFMNPARSVAQLYRDAIEARRPCFSVVAFAVYHPGYGPDNYTPFAEFLA